MCILVLLWHAYRSYAELKNLVTEASMSVVREYIHQQRQVRTSPQTVVGSSSRTGSDNNKPGHDDDNDGTLLLQINYSKDLCRQLLSQIKLIDN